ALSQSATDAGDDRTLDAGDAVEQVRLRDAERGREEDRALGGADVEVDPIGLDPLRDDRDGRGGERELDRGQQPEPARGMDEGVPSLQLAERAEQDRLERGRSFDEPLVLVDPDGL